MPETRRAKQNRTGAAARLLAWYDKHRRVLPWRAAPGESPDPYGVWLSEIMLQQTTVAAVGNYYREFLSRWPDVQALASASLDEVRAAWAGLGYYSRARNLHRTAEIVARDLGGTFPRDASALRRLPGIGPYTAGAIAAIAFDAREAAVDANAERVIARRFAVGAALPKAKPALRTHAQALVPERRAGDFAQALMDLGALVCTAKRPACADCPWTEDCRARQLGLAESLPRKGEKSQRPLKRGAAFVARNRDGAILLVKRPEEGLLGGMLQPPLGPWDAKLPSRDEVLAQAPFGADWQRRPGLVRHGFTHFELEIAVWRADISTRRNIRGLWLAPHELARAALPTVMRKILAHAFDDISRGARPEDRPPSRPPSHRASAR
ncbi:MAG: A/G-specific adenine glycosylase [Rhizomicrobium sp.]